MISAVYERHSHLMGFIMAWISVDKALPLPFPMYLNPSQKPFTKLTPINEINSGLHWKSHGSLLIFSLSELVLLHLLTGSQNQRCRYFFHLWLNMTDPDWLISTHEQSHKWISRVCRRCGLMAFITRLASDMCMCLDVCHMALRCKTALCLTDIVSATGGEIDFELKLQQCFLH